MNGPGLVLDRRRIGGGLELDGKLAVNRLYVGIGLVSDFFVFSGIGTILVCRSRIGI